MSAAWRMCGRVLLFLGPHSRRPIAAARPVSVLPIDDALSSAPFTLAPPRCISAARPTFAERDTRPTMLRAAAVSALCMALAGEASGFAPSAPLPLYTAR